MVMYIDRCRVYLFSIANTITSLYLIIQKHKPNIPDGHVLCINNNRGSQTFHDTINF
jgi:hypothetical protein